MKGRIMDQKEKAQRKKKGESFPVAPPKRRRGMGSPKGRLVKIKGKGISMNTENHKEYQQKLQQRTRRY